MGDPDFERLGRETLWSAATWRWTWDYLEPQGQWRPALWRNVLSFVQTGCYGPRASASMLVKALVEPTRAESEGSA